MAALFYFINFRPGFGFGDEPFGVAWSLAIEEQFYLTWPIFLISCARLRQGRLLAVVATLAAVSLVLRFQGPIGTLDGSFMSYSLPHTNAWSLLFGAALAIHLSGGRRLHVPAGPATAAAAAILLLASLPGWQNGVHSVLTPAMLVPQLATGAVVAVCAVVLVAAAVGNPSANGWKGPPGKSLRHHGPPRSADRCRHDPVRRTRRGRLTTLGGTTVPRSRSATRGAVAGGFRGLSALMSRGADRRRIEENRSGA